MCLSKLTTSIVLKALEYVHPTGLKWADNA